MQCLILAGGLGTRIRALDPSVPKSLLNVAGQPFVHWQLSWLASQGVDSVVLSIGHLGGHIEAYVGDGAPWNVRVRYVQESSGLRGTGGALRLAVDDDAVEDHFFVLYGDSYLDVDLADVERAFIASRLPALMTVYENDGRWDTSNVICANEKVVRYVKAPTNPPVEMRFIDYGLSVISADVIKELIPAGQSYDLSSAFSLLSDEGRLGAFVATERFYEIGSLQGLQELDEKLSRSSKRD